MTSSYGQPAPPPPPRIRVRIVMALAVVVFAALAGIGISWGIRQWSGGGTAGSTGTAGSAGSAGSSASAGSSGSAGSGGSAGSQASGGRLKVDVPSAAKTCGAATTTEPFAAKAGNASTSCGFALAVRAAYVAAAPAGAAVVVDAVSPVTGKKYAMTCTDTVPVLCSGGDGAIVYLIA